MRVVLRVLFFEFSLAWALLLAGSVRVTAQLLPFFTQTISAAWRDRWRVRTGLLIGIPALGGGAAWLGDTRDTQRPTDTSATSAPIASNSASTQRCGTRRVMKTMRLLRSSDGQRLSQAGA